LGCKWFCLFVDEVLPNPESEKENVTRSFQESENKKQLVVWRELR
jgi:hypothetical protein